MIQGNSRALNDLQNLYGMNIQIFTQTVIPCHIVPRSQGSVKEGDRKESLKGTHTLQMVAYKVPRFSLKNSGYSELVRLVLCS